MQFGCHIDATDAHHHSLLQSIRVATTQVNHPDYNISLLEQMGTQVILIFHPFWGNIHCLLCTCNIRMTRSDILPYPIVSCQTAVKQAL